METVQGTVGGWGLVLAVAAGLWVGCSPRAEIGEAESEGAAGGADTGDGGGSEREGTDSAKAGSQALGASGGTGGKPGGTGGKPGGTGGKPGDTGGSTSETDSSAGDTGSSAGDTDGSTSNPPNDLGIVGNLDGRLIQTPCAADTATDDCSIRGIVDQQFVACQNGQLDIALDHPIAGTPGAQYAATLHFYGVVDPKNYGDTGARESGTIRPQHLSSGAEPPPWHIGVPGQNAERSSYSSYEIHVFDQNEQEVGVYYVNSDTQEDHYTYVLNFERTIPIVGGGRVRVRMFDSNCRQIKNCGATSEAPCSPNVRAVDISAANPQPELGLPPAGFDQPGLGQSNDDAGQWFLIDVTNVQPL